MKVAQPSALTARFVAAPPGRGRLSVGRNEPVTSGDNRAMPQRTPEPEPHPPRR